jgi:hypothetical protein
VTRVLANARAGCGGERVASRDEQGLVLDAERVPKRVRSGREPTSL